jgi:hypothetical protein
MLAILPFAAWSAAAAPVEQIACPEGPYHVAPFTMTVDYAAKTLQTSGADPEPDSAKFTDATVE